MAVFCGFPLIHHLLDHVDQAPADRAAAMVLSASPGAALTSKPLSY
jgi:hypothetical protein